jgi:hypothetical protein
MLNDNKPSIKQMGNDMVSPNNNSKNILDLDNEIPNYTKNILDNANKKSADLQESIEEAKQIAGAFITEKWNELRILMQNWSIGVDEVQQPQQQQLGGKKKRTRGRKQKSKAKKSKHNKK